MMLDKIARDIYVEPF